MILGDYLAENQDARAFAGYDVGRYVDTGEFSCLVVGKESIGIERVARTYRKTPFVEQQRFLARYLSLPRTYLAIDETGMGLPISEELRTTYRGRVRGINFGSTIDVPARYQDRTAPAKTALAVVLKQAMLDGEVRWQVDRAKNAQMYSVRRSVTKSANLTFEVEQGSGGHGHHHADVFWARALAVWCWKMHDYRPTIRVTAL